MSHISRRTFIKGLSVGAAAMATPAWLRQSLAQAQVGFPGKEEMYKILLRALARGGQYSDLFIESRAQSHIVVADSEIKTLEYGVLQGGVGRNLFVDHRDDGAIYYFVGSSLIPVLQALGERGFGAE